MKKEFTHEDYEICKKWINEEIGIIDVGKYLGNKRNHASNYIFLARCLRYFNK